MDIDYPLHDNAAIGIETAQQLVPVEDATRLRHQRLEQQEFGRRQRYASAVYGDSVLCLIKDEPVVVRMTGRRTRTARATKNGLHSGDQLGKTTWFHHEIVGAQGEPPDTMMCLP